MLIRVFAVVALALASCGAPGGRSSYPEYPAPSPPAPAGSCASRPASGVPAAACDVNGGPIRCAPDGLLAGPLEQHLEQVFYLGDAVASALRIDAEGNVVVGGNYGGTKWIASQKLPHYGTTTSHREPNFFVARLGTDGSAWAKGFGARDSQYSLTSLTLDGAGNLYVGASGDANARPIDLGGGPLGTAFLASISPDGRYRWGHSTDSTSSSFVAQGDALMGVEFFGGHSAPEVIHRWSRIVRRDASSGARVPLATYAYDPWDDSKCVPYVLHAASAAGTAFEGIEGGRLPNDQPEFWKCFGLISPEGAILWWQSFSREATVALDIDDAGTLFAAKVDWGRFSRDAGLRVTGFDLPMAPWSTHVRPDPAVGNGGISLGGIISRDDGTVVVVGTMRGTVDFGGGPRGGAKDRESAFVWGLDKTTGEHRFSYAFSGWGGVGRASVADDGARGFSVLLHLDENAWLGPHENMCRGAYLLRFSNST